MIPHDKFSILGINVSAINLALACQLVESCIENKEKIYICVAPVSTLVSCHEDPRYRNVVNEADIVTPDGMPLVWWARRKGFKQVQRTYGPDFMLALCDFGQNQEYKHYLLGATVDTCRKLEQNLKTRFLDIKIVGAFSPPFRELSEEENQQMIEDINSAHPDIVWVGLGSPKQDFWMKRNRDKINASVLVGVGAAFDFIAGVKPQAPRWMRQSGLEWLFRLCSEPQRLWKRYLIGNTKFIYYLLRDFIIRKSVSQHV
jgi:N-acetylglucosaminyldiphosphoundecaprenol N-acetyl-beta-D-mannosaminyltransferase